MPEPTREILDTLACEIELRPREAPSLMDIAPFVRSRDRDADAITVVFDPAAADQLERFAAAERTCCSRIGWHVEREPAVVLRITATREQLDAIEGMLGAPA